MDPLDGAGREEVVLSRTGDGGKEVRDEVDDVDIRLDWRLCFLPLPLTEPGSSVGLSSV